MEVETKPEVKAEEPRTLRKLSVMDLQPTEAAQQQWTVFAPEGTTRDDVTNPLYWAHVAKMVRSMAKIHVITKDGSWYGEYLVTYHSGSELRVEELIYKVLDPEMPADLESSYYIKWVSAPLMYGVVRKSDGQRVKDRFPNKGDAMLWMKQNEKALRL